MANPFALPETPQSAWTAKEHQAAANYHWYEAQGYTEEAFQRGDCGANYKPLWSLHSAAHRDHTRKAATLRAAQ